MKHLLVLFGAVGIGCSVAPPPTIVQCGGNGNTTTSNGGSGGGTQTSGGTAGTGGTSGSGGATATGGGTATGGAPPTGDWVKTAGNLTSLVSECGNMSYLSVKPDEDLMIAGISLNGLWGSTDGSMSWHALGTGAGSAMITNRTSTILYDPDNPMVFYESGIYNGGGVYMTNDDGMTFTQMGDVTHCDHVSVDFSDPARKTLLAGGHEQQQILHHTADAGMMWDNIGMGLPSGTTCTYPLVIDAQHLLVGCGAYGSGMTGIMQSTDGGTTWTSLTSEGGSHGPLHAADGSYYWSTSITLGGGMVRSTDNGMTWARTVGPNVIAGASPIELPDGRIAALGLKYVMISKDQGATWAPVSSALPYNDATGVVYSPDHKAFYIWHFSCGSPMLNVPDDAIMRFDFDYEAK